MAIVTIFPDGRILSRAAIPQKFISTGSGNQSVTFPDLRNVEYVISPDILTTVATNVSVMNYAAAVNVVGLTLNVGTSTTIFGELFAVGF